MKKTVLLLLTLFVMVNSVLAEDLSDYPDIFIRGSNLNVITAVGDQASASHVLAQTQIALSLTSEVNRQAPGLTRLASEIDRIDEINLISIGNACDNALSSQIFNDPEPCEGNLDPSKASLELVQNENGMYHLVLNAYGDVGIRALADVLVNYDDYNLNGNIFEINVQGEEERTFEQPATTPKKTTPVKVDEVEEKEEEEPEPVLIAEETEDEQDNQQGRILLDSDSQPEPVLKDEDNIILKIVNWFKNLFR